MPITGISSVNSVALRYTQEVNKIVVQKKKILNNYTVYCNY